MRALLDGKPLTSARRKRARTSFALRSAHAPRELNVNFQPVDVKAGTHEVTLECVRTRPGRASPDLGEARIGNRCQDNRDEVVKKWGLAPSQVTQTP